MTKNYILAPILIPNKKIIRNANNIINETHQIYFSEETIKKIKDNFHKKNQENKININHNEEIFGLTLTKSFLINNENKNELPKDFQELPIGTWMLEYIVEDDTIWKMIEEKKLNGLSLEGVFQYNLINEIQKEVYSTKANKEKLLEIRFDETLFQVSKSNIQERIDNNYIYSEFEIIKEWKSKYGYKFNIYGNDHFIDNKPHFHFDNKQDNLYCKISFDGEIFEIKNNKKLPKNIYKELKYFLSKIENQTILKEMWNDKNPTLNVE